MGLPIIGLVIGIAGSLLQAGYTAYAANQQAKAENAQLKMDMETERIQAMSEQNNRLEQFQRLEAANRVAVAVSGGNGARNYSYEQGIAPYNKEVAGRDVNTIEFNSQMRTGRMAYQIKVNKFNARSEAIGAGVGAVADIGGQVGTYISRPGGLLA